MSGVQDSMLDEAEWWSLPNQPQAALFDHITWDDWVFDDDSLNSHSAPDVRLQICAKNDQELVHEPVMVYHERGHVLVGESMAQAAVAMEDRNYQQSRSKRTIQDIVTTPSGGTSAIDTPLRSVCRPHKRQRMITTPGSSSKTLQMVQRRDSSFCKKPEVTLLASHQLKALTDWLSDHRDNPYPSLGEKHKLAERSNLSISQVTSWMSRSRRKLHAQEFSKADHPYEKSCVNRSRKEVHASLRNKRSGARISPLYRREVKIYSNLHKFFRLIAADEVRSTAGVSLDQRKRTKGRSQSMAERRRPVFVTTAERMKRACTSVSDSNQGTLKYRCASHGSNASLAANLATHVSDRDGVNFDPPASPSISVKTHRCTQKSVSQIGHQRLKIDKWLASLPSCSSALLGVQSNLDLSAPITVQQYINILRRQKRYGVQLWRGDLEADELVSSEVISLTKQRRQTCAVFAFWQQAGWDSGAFAADDHPNPDHPCDVDKVKASLLDFDVATSTEACFSCLFMLKLRCKTDFHLVEHDGDKRFVCPCMRCFQSLEELTQHVKTEHHSWGSTRISPRVEYLDSFTYGLFNQWFRNRKVTVASWGLALAWPQPASLSQWRNATRLLYLPPQESSTGQVCYIEAQDSGYPPSEHDHVKESYVERNDLPEYDANHTKSVAVFSGASSALSGQSSCSYASFGPRKGRQLPFAGSNKSRQKSTTQKFYCVFGNCQQSFNRKSAWRRHEASIHMPKEVYVCGPRPGHASVDWRLSKSCPFCGQDCTVRQLTVNSVHLCWRRPVADRIFYRRDTFGQHLNFMHQHRLAQADSLGWTHEADTSYYPKQCNFCLHTFSVWDERYDHMAQHFENGDRIRFQSSMKAQGLKIPLHKEVNAGTAVVSVG